MKFSLNRESLLKPLLLVSGAVERKSTLPILGNILFDVSEQSLKLTATDLELEMVSYCEVDNHAENGKLTIPARKLLDICKSLPDQSLLAFETDNEVVKISTGRSKYSLSTLPASDFPNIEEWKGDVEFKLLKSELLRLIESTHFSMANQDVRYYLNGMSIESENNEIRSVATDGHRLARIDTQLPEGADTLPGVIVPRKTVGELRKLLDDDEMKIAVSVSETKIRFSTPEIILTSKVIDGSFPDYTRVIPQGNTRRLEVDAAEFAQAVDRVSTVSSERSRAVKLTLEDDRLVLSVNAPDSGAAEEELVVAYADERLEIGFNAKYL
jgi:DNA polymerase-3 subunit beta